MEVVVSLFPGQDEAPISIYINVGVPAEMDRVYDLFGLDMDLSYKIWINLTIPDDEIICA